MGKSHAVPSNPAYLLGPVSRTSLSKGLLHFCADVFRPQPSKSMRLSVFDTCSRR